MRNGLRLDRFLVYCRFARTRVKAQALIEGGHMRLNRAHVQRTCTPVAAGDVLTFMSGSDIRIIEILGLPERRRAPAIAQTFYRELDRDGKSALAAGNCRT